MQCYNLMIRILNDSLTNTHTKHALSLFDAIYINCGNAVFFAMCKCEGPGGC